MCKNALSELYLQHKNLYVTNMCVNEIRARFELYKYDGQIANIHTKNNETQQRC